MSETKKPVSMKRAQRTLVKEGIIAGIELSNHTVSKLGKEDSDGKHVYDVAVFIPEENRKRVMYVSIKGDVATANNIFVLGTKVEATVENAQYSRIINELKLENGSSYAITNDLVRLGLYKKKK